MRPIEQGNRNRVLKVTSPPCRRGQGLTFWPASPLEGAPKQNNGEIHGTVGGSPLHLIPKKGRRLVRIRLVRSHLFFFLVFFILCEFYDPHPKTKLCFSLSFFCFPIVHLCLRYSHEGLSVWSTILLHPQTGAPLGGSSSVRQTMEHAVLLEM